MALPGLVIATGAAAFWLAFARTTVPAVFDDSVEYIALADALARLRPITSVRTVGYPIVLVALRPLAWALGARELETVVAVQALLLSGVATYLVYLIALHVSGRRAVAAVAVVLFATDVDVHNLGATILTEPLTILLALWMTWWRLRDASWRRACWVLAWLVLTRPSFLPLPVGLALVDAVRLARLRPAWTLAWPSVALVLASSLALRLSGADPTGFRGHAWLAVFGKVHAAKAWSHLPDSPERQWFEKVDGLNMYDAASNFERDHGADALRRATLAAIAEAPFAVVRACLEVIPKEFTSQTTYIEEGWHGDVRWTWWVYRWHAIYRGIFYASFALFVALVTSAAVNGVRTPGAVAPMRHVIVPYLVFLFTSVAALSLADYEVGRLAITFHPFFAILLALLLDLLLGAASTRTDPQTG